VVFTFAATMVFDRGSDCRIYNVTTLGRARRDAGTPTVMQRQHVAAERSHLKSSI
jgi:serine acetyltransferase